MVRCTGNSCRLLVLLASVALGCAADGRDKWVRHHGGIVFDSRLDRLARVSQPILDTAHERRVLVAVLDSEEPCAYSWPDGHVYLTDALVDMLDDSELAAAIAHELGHLSGERRRGSPVAALHGKPDLLEAEASADWAGVQLLLRSGLPPSAMASMLAKVAASPAVPPESRVDLVRRAALLRKGVSPDLVSR